MGTKSGFGSGMNSPDHNSESLEKYPGWKKFGSGINIPDPQHCFHVFQGFGSASI
jgi:hypothetical protein